MISKAILQFLNWRTAKTGRNCALLPLGAVRFLTRRAFIPVAKEFTEKRIEIPWTHEETLQFVQEWKVSEELEKTRKDRERAMHLAQVAEYGPCYYRSDDYVCG